MLTIQRITSLRNVRTLWMQTDVHVQDSRDNLSFVAPMLGLFHTRICAVTAIFKTHYGKVNSLEQPASLWRHNEILRRKHINTAKSLPYKISQHLVQHSLYARLLDIICIQSNSRSLAGFAQHLDSLSDTEAFKKLKGTVEGAITAFTSPKRAGTDDVLRSSILFIRDSLLFHSFITSIRSGDTEMIILILKVWAIAFRGAGRTNYAAELLHLRHNILYAWPPPLR